MSRTPWGDSAELRARRLRPGPGTPREMVVRNQRERLFGAMVATAAEKGYQATSVADLVELSGVSRSDFYRHFANKEDCFLAALAAIVTLLREAAQRSVKETGSGLRTLAELVAAQPAAARFCLITSHEVGERAVAMVEEASRPFEELLGQAFAAQPETAGMPARIVAALAGGMRKVVHTHLYRREEERLVELVEELRQWSRTYRPPPRPLPTPRRGRGAERQFDGYTTAQRIARAVAATATEKGYPAVGADDIAGRAAISLATFYAHFANKEEAMLSAIELSGALMLATVSPAARQTPDWRRGVRAAHEAMCAFLAAEPDFARLMIAEANRAGPQALAQRDRIIASLESLLAPGYAECPQTPAVAAEAIGGTVYALLRDQLRSRGAASLVEVAPLATYLTLTPFVGAAEAYEVASGG